MRRLALLTCWLVVSLVIVVGLWPRTRSAEVPLPEGSWVAGFLPDSPTAVVTRQGEPVVELWDLVAGRRLAAHTLPDGAETYWLRADAGVVGLSFEGDPRGGLLDAATGRLLARLDGQFGEAVRAGPLVAVEVWDGDGARPTVTALYDRADGRLVRTLPGWPAGSAPDGGYLATGEGDKFHPDRVTAWDLATGQALGRLPQTGHLSGDGRWQLGCNDDLLREVSTGTVRETGAGYTLEEPVFPAGGRWLVGITSKPHGSTERLLWCDLDTGEVRPGGPAANPLVVTGASSLRCEPGGRVLRLQRQIWRLPPAPSRWLERALPAGWWDAGEGDTYQEFRLLDAETGATRLAGVGHVWVTSASDDGRVAVTGSEERQFVVWWAPHPSRWFVLAVALLGWSLAAGLVARRTGGVRGVAP